MAKDLPDTTPYPVFSRQRSPKQIEATLTRMEDSSMKVIFRIASLLLFIGVFFLMTGHLGFAAEVNGIYTEPTTKDLGTVSGIKAFEGIKTRGWISTYYDYNLNTPAYGTPIGGRTFDIRDSSFSLELAEIELEKVPNPGEVGFKFDLATGDTMDQIFNGIKAFYGDKSLTETDRFFQHASVSYVAPIGRGLRFDAGKFVTHIGGETIEGIKNNNFSHTYFYSYAIPFQDTGVRINYPWTDNFYTELYVLNGWNTTIDNDKQKSVGPSIGWTIGPVSWYVNYLVGNESDTVTAPIGSRSTYRTLLDSQLYYTLGALNLAANYDKGTQDKIPGALLAQPVVGNKNVNWSGYTFWVRYKVTDNFEPSLRYEIYNDPNGFTVGTVADRFTSATVTLNYRLGQGGSHLLVRPEYRWDKANKDVSIFKDKDGKDKDTQSTVGLNLVYYF